MIHFLGEYEVTLDAKGRFLLPAKLLSQLPEREATNFVINRGFDDCLNLYPMQNWMVVSSEIEDLPDHDDDNRKLKKYFNYGVATAELDSANRILLPAPLKDYAGLSKDIVLSCSKKRIEIWDKSKFHQFFDSFTATEFSSLYKKVMTPKNGQ
ncbi:MAG: division/cell wall cluster transcriptional repressor MraZ [Chitinophagaceae bacterium]